jgi:hypothetical protein
MQIICLNPLLILTLTPHISFPLNFQPTEYIVLLARNGGKTIRIIKAGKPGFRSVRQHFALINVL